jgi:proteasome alpha subunit
MQGTVVDDLDLGAAVQVAVAAIAGPERTLAANELEVAVLDRSNGRRRFRRLTVAELEGLGVNAPQPAIAAGDADTPAGAGG